MYGRRDIHQVSWSFLIGITLLPFLISLFGCQRSSLDNEVLDLDGVTIQRNTNPAVPNAVNAALRNSPLSAAEQQALQQVVNAKNNNAPAEDATLGADILAEAKRLKQLEDENVNTAMDRVSLISKIIQSCEAQVEEIDVKQGEDFRGEWSGKACTSPGGKGKKINLPGAAVKFTVAGDGMSGPYTLSGASRGQVGARPDGTCQANGDPWGGELFYAQGSGGIVQAGTFYNRKFSPAGKSGAFNTCSMGIRLDKSTNDRPEKHIELTRRLYACYTKALWVTSPLATFIFAKFPPQIASVLMRQVLGIR